MEKEIKIKIDIDEILNALKQEMPEKTLPNKFFLFFDQKPVKDSFYQAQQIRQNFFRGLGVENV